MSWTFYTQQIKELVGSVGERFRDLFASPESDPSRRSFLLGGGAVLAAALIAPNLPALQESFPEFEIVPWTARLDCSLMDEIEQRAVEDIMAAEDARVLEQLAFLSQYNPSKALS